MKYRSYKRRQAQSGSQRQSPKMHKRAVKAYAAEIREQHCDLAGFPAMRRATGPRRIA